MLAKEWKEIENQSERKHDIASGSRRHKQWNTIADWVSDQKKGSLENNIMVNIAFVLFEKNISFVPQDLEKSYKKFSGVFT